VRENALILRIVRLLRIVRIISVLPELRVLISGMIRAVRPIGAMAAMTMVLLFVYGMIGVKIFSEELPERWGDVGTAMLTLFTVLTLEGWNEILFDAQEVTQYAWVFLVSFVLFASFLVINVLIAIIITAVEEAREAELAEEIEERIQEVAAGEREPDPVADLIDRVGDMRRGLQEIELELGVLDLRAKGAAKDPDEPPSTVTR
jgi:voltage-gated sodium channel